MPVAGDDFATPGEGALYLPWRNFHIKVGRIFIKWGPNAEINMGMCVVVVR